MHACWWIPYTKLRTDFLKIRDVSRTTKSILGLLVLICYIFSCRIKICKWNLNFGFFFFFFFFLGDKSWKIWPIVRVWHPHARDLSPVYRVLILCKMDTAHLSYKCSWASVLDICILKELDFITTIITTLVLKKIIFFFFFYDPHHKMASGWWNAT